MDSDPYLLVEVTREAVELVAAGGPRDGQLAVVASSHASALAMIGESTDGLRWLRAAADTYRELSISTAAAALRSVLDADTRSDHPSIRPRVRFSAVDLLEVVDAPAEPPRG